MLKFIEFENQIFQIIQKEALDFNKNNNKTNDGDRFLVKKTSPGFYSMFDVIIEDKKENDIYGVIIIKLKSINIGFHSIRNKLNRMKLQLSKNVSKVIIIADYNPKNDDHIEIIKRNEDNLKTKGLFFVGIDVIGNYLTEINVTSPTGRREINRINKTKIEKIFWDKVQTKLII